MYSIRESVSMLKIKNILYMALFGVSVVNANVEKNTKIEFLNEKYTETFTASTDDGTLGFEKYDDVLTNDVKKTGVVGHIGNVNTTGKVSISIANVKHTYDNKNNSIVMFTMKIESDGKEFGLGYEKSFSLPIVAIQHLSPKFIIGGGYKNRTMSGSIVANINTYNNTLKDITYGLHTLDGFIAGNIDVWHCCLKTPYKAVIAPKFAVRFEKSDKIEQFSDSTTSVHGKISAFDFDRLVFDGMVDITIKKGMHSVLFGSGITYVDVTPTHTYYQQDTSGNSTTTKTWSYATSNVRFKVKFGYMYTVQENMDIGFTYQYGIAKNVKYQNAIMGIDIAF